MSYCLMSNHLHLLVNTEENFKLQDVIRDFKKFSSKKLIAQIKQEPESRRDWMLELFSAAANSSRKHTHYKLWQVGNHAIEIYSQKFTKEKIGYIHNNPVKAGYVNKPEDWRYSSASNYLEQISVLEEVFRVQF